MQRNCSLRSAQLLLESIERVWRLKAAVRATKVVEYAEFLPLLVCLHLMPSVVLFSVTMCLCVNRLCVRQVLKLRRRADSDHCAARQPDHAGERLLTYLLTGLVWSCCVAAGVRRSPSSNVHNTRRWLPHSCVALAAIIARNTSLSVTDASFPCFAVNLCSPAATTEMLSWLSASSIIEWPIIPSNS